MSTNTTTPNGSIGPELIERVERLESELEDVKEENAELHERVDDLEDSLEQTQQWVWDLEDLVLGEFDMPAAELEAKEQGGVLDRVERLEQGEVNAEDLVMASADSYLPIQQKWNAVQAGVDHGLTENQELAARVWPNFREFADVSQSKFILKSPKVRDIIEREIEMVDYPNPNTVRRVMRFIAKFSDGLIEFDDSSHTNRLCANKDEWNDRMQEMIDATNDAAEDTDDAKKDYTVVNSSGGVA